ENATEADQRAIARGVAVLFGGLCAERNGKLTLRHVEDRAPQRRRRASEV
ncbi:MAG: hypothetical protein QOF71_369, partial [Candidatus Eremiobacteraeota bacterium]|nr:hypothetical protein [Candidatus Eremiobacteraeota bacterium]